MTLMRGAHPLRENLKLFLEAKVPTMVTRAGELWGVQLVQPKRYESYEPTGLRHGDGPLIAVGVERASNFVTVDMDQWGANEFRVTYSCSVYTWCFTEEDEDGEVPLDARTETLRLRDDLATVVRAVILGNLNFGHEELYQLDERSLTEMYSEGSAVPNASGRWVAGVVHTFDVKSDESLDLTGTRYLGSAIVETAILE